MTNTMTRCPVCRSEDATAVSVPYKFIRHQDFMPMAHQLAKLAKCNSCQTIFIGEKELFPELDGIYQGEEYARKKKTQHVVFGISDPVKGTMETTYSYFAELIDRQISLSGKQRKLSILDIGCFNGKLLIELSRRYPEATMHGFDVSEYIRELFPDGENFTYFSGDLGKIDRQYDVISMLNVLAYVDDIQSLMKSIGNLLKPEGFVFLVSTNVKKNPYLLTCGDQYTYQTPVNLTNFGRHFGYGVDMVTDDPFFPRSIIGTARRQTIPEKAVYEQDDTLANSLEYLSKAAKKLLDAVSEYQHANMSGRIAVLGATNNAAWAQNIAGDAISFFVDENPYRIGSKFYGKDVVHPSHLKEDDLLLIPYGETSDILAKKFSSLYKARIFTI